MTWCCRSGHHVPQAKLIHPRIEPEIVFIMGERLKDRA